jgi:undecaprenyl-diphosphatase
MVEEGHLRGVLDRITIHDHRWLDALSRHEARPWADLGFRIVTLLGGAVVTVGITLVLIAVPATRHLGLVVGLANLGSHLAVQALKRLIVRPRPTTRWPHVTALAAIPDDFSFPSGHACAAMALATATLLLEPPAGIPAMALAFLVGASRVYLRVHYVTDVVVGQALGAGAALITALSLP